MSLSNFRLFFDITVSCGFYRFFLLERHYIQIRNLLNASLILRGLFCPPYPVHYLGFIKLIFTLCSSHIPERSVLCQCFRLLFLKFALSYVFMPFKRALHSHLWLPIISLHLGFSPNYSTEIQKKISKRLFLKNSCIFIFGHAGPRLHLDCPPFALVLTHGNP